MKIYISGKITGLSPAEYLPLFDEAEFNLKLAGFTDIVNPTKLGIAPDEDWKTAMDVCMPALEQCDTIYMLENWPQSFGARRELTRAMEKKFKVVFAPGGIEDLKQYRKTG
jgi:hypothetical protein